jgi:MFS family permease
VWYAGLGLLGYLLNGLGAVLGPLQHELQVARTQVAFYPSVFAAALVVVGLVGGRFVERLGHRLSLIAALSGLVAGAVLLAVPAHAVSSFASVLAPIAIAAATFAGAGWRVGYLVPVLPVAVAVLLAIAHDRRSTADQDDDGAARTMAAEARGREPGPALGRWIAVLLAVSVEFCLVFWAAAAFGDWHDVGPAAAPALAASFLLGMALTRSAAARLVAGRHPLDVVLAGCAVAAGASPHSGLRRARPARRWACWWPAPGSRCSTRSRWPA